MATVRNNKNSEFLDQLEKARIEVKEKISKAHRLLQETEYTLLRQLNEIQYSYDEQQLKEEGQTDMFLTKKESSELFQEANEKQKTLVRIPSPLDGKQKLMKEEHNIELTWCKEAELEHLIRQICSISHNTKPVSHTVYYQDRGNPILTDRKSIAQTFLNGQFRSPTALAISPITKNIYVCEPTNDCVLAFNHSCEYIFAIRQHMKYPSGIGIYGDYIYVSQSRGNAICHYTGSGEFLRSVGKEGIRLLQFKCPLGISISDPSKLIYVCDRDNHRIQVLNIDLSIKSFIYKLVRPLDVKVDQNTSEIYVLDKKNPCLHVYSHEHQLIREFVSLGNNCQIINCDHFCIDEHSNVLLTDSTACRVVIFGKDMQIVKYFGKKGNDSGDFVNPNGIAIDGEGRIVVSSQNLNNCIQFF